VAPLKPSKPSNKYLYVFFDTEYTQDLEKCDGSFEHVPNIICGQQMCCECDAVDDVNVDCEPCRKRVHTFWQDPVGKFIDYLRLSRQFSDKIYVISHNSRGYDAQFLLRRFLELRWEPKLIMDGSKILSMVVENLHFVDSLNYLPVSLKSMPKSFDLTYKKRYYPHFFNTVRNLNSPEPDFYGTGFISVDERSQFMQWHQEQKGKLFSTKNELLAYCMDDVNVLWQACCAFQNLFLKLVKKDPFREAITTSSIFNEVFRTMFLKPDAVCIIPRTGYRMGIYSLLKVFSGCVYGTDSQHYSCRQWEDSAFGRGT